jgi:hypothetical protein
MCEGGSFGKQYYIVLGQASVKNILHVTGGINIPLDQKGPGVASMASLVSSQCNPGSDRGCILWNWEHKSLAAEGRCSRR